MRSKPRAKRPAYQSWLTVGTSERVVGELIASQRDRFVLTTKYTLNARPDEPHAGGTHTKSMSQARETSLRRLGTDSIDLYWVHAWDFLTPVDEVMRALNDAVRAGRVCRRRAAQRLGLLGGCRTGSHPGQVAASAAA